MSPLGLLFLFSIACTEQLSLDGWERIDNSLHLVFSGTSLQEKEGYLARLQIKQSEALEPQLFTFPIQVLNDTTITIPFDKDIPRGSLYTVESFSFLQNPDAQPESVTLSSSTFFYPVIFTVLSVNNELGPLAFLVATRDSRFTFALTLKSSEGETLTSSSCGTREGELYFRFEIQNDQIPSGYYVPERVLATKDGTTEAHFIDAYGVQLPLPAVTSIECIPAIRGQFFLVLHGSGFPIEDPTSYVMFKLPDESINCSIKHETRVVGLSEPLYGSQPYELSVTATLYQNDGKTSLDFLTDTQINVPAFDSPKILSITQDGLNRRLLVEGSELPTSELVTMTLTVNDTSYPQKTVQLVVRVDDGTHGTIDLPDDFAPGKWKMVSLSLTLGDVTSTDNDHTVITFLFNYVVPSNFRALSTNTVSFSLFLPSEPTTVHNISIYQVEFRKYHPIYYEQGQKPQEWIFKFDLNPDYFSQITLMALGTYESEVFVPFVLLSKTAGSEYSPSVTLPISTMTSITFTPLYREYLGRLSIQTDVAMSWDHPTVFLSSVPNAFFFELTQQEITTSFRGNVTAIPFGTYTVDAMTDMNDTARVLAATNSLTVPISRLLIRSLTANLDQQRVVVGINADEWASSLEAFSSLTLNVTLPDGSEELFTVEQTGDSLSDLFIRVPNPVRGIYCLNSVSYEFGGESCVGTFQAAFFMFQCPLVTKVQAGVLNDVPMFLLHGEGFPLGNTLEVEFEDIDPLSVSTFSSTLARYLDPLPFNRDTPYEVKSVFFYAPPEVVVDCEILDPSFVLFNVAAVDGYSIQDRVLTITSNTAHYPIISYLSGNSRIHLSQLPDVVGYQYTLPTKQIPDDGIVSFDRFFTDGDMVYQHLHRAEQDCFTPLSLLLPPPEITSFSLIRLNELNDVALLIDGDHFREGINIFVTLLQDGSSLPIEVEVIAHGKVFFACTIIRHLFTSKTVSITSASLKHSSPFIDQPVSTSQTSPVSVTSSPSVSRVRQEKSDSTVFVCGYYFLTDDRVKATLHIKDAQDNKMSRPLTFINSSCMSFQMEASMTGKWSLDSIDYRIGETVTTCTIQTPRSFYYPSPTVSDIQVLPPTATSQSSVVQFKLGNVPEDIEIQRILLIFENGQSSSYPSTALGDHQYRIELGLRALPGHFYVSYCETATGQTIYCIPSNGIIPATTLSDARFENLFNSYTTHSVLLTFDSYVIPTLIYGTVTNPSTSTAGFTIPYKNMEFINDKTLQCKMEVSSKLLPNTYTIDTVIFDHRILETQIKLTISEIQFTIPHCIDNFEPSLDKNDFTTILLTGTLNSDIEIVSLDSVYLLVDNANSVGAATSFSGKVITMTTTSANCPFGSTLNVPSITARGDADLDVATLSIKSASVQVPDHPFAIRLITAEYDQTDPLKCVLSFSLSEWGKFTDSCRPHSETQEFTFHATTGNDQPDDVTLPFTLKTIEVDGQTIGEWTCSTTIGTEGVLKCSTTYQVVDAPGSNFSITATPAFTTPVQHDVPTVIHVRTPGFDSLPCGSAARPCSSVSTGVDVSRLFSRTVHSFTIDGTTQLGKRMTVRNGETTTISGSSGKTTMILQTGSIPEAGLVSVETDALFKLSDLTLTISTSSANTSPFLISASGDVTFSNIDVEPHDSSNRMLAARLVDLNGQGQ
ncbi:hypothetical protein BLNAU_6752 [Blattamonas nauphoetae]|uniref:Uncharacterized protein n=1 Tax=Blattamonas nauphoetae TaxID=2049346 RepID=A0ABQ9Y3H7_9EUKA|nr:hypothetical protein BLNAU_6752 [Blattamonas nauphoetae]